MSFYARVAIAWVALQFLGASGCTPRAIKAPQKSDQKVALVASKGAAPEPGAVSPVRSPRPRLVLWLTIDQMRGDYLERYRSHFGAGGFERLTRSGVVFENAHYTHAITETAPGHATLFTGVAPAVHGIIGNSWVLPTGETTSSVTDATETVVGPGTAPNRKTGHSPRLLLVPTLGDQLTINSGGRSIVLGLSTKDRSAILPAGQTGRAVWMGERGFVTSSYYGPEAIPWLPAHHLAHPPERYVAGGWTLLLPEDQYKTPLVPSAYAPTSLGAEFPHVLVEGADRMEALKNSPFGDTAVVDLAIAALREEAFGADDAPDLLAVSLSSTDLIGHRFGPESREMEDQMIRVDRQLARLLDALEQSGKLATTLVVLSADHGGCESAESSAKLGLPARRLSESAIEEAARSALKRAYKNDRMILAVESPYVYLDAAAIAKAGAQRADVRRIVRAAIASLPGVYGAYAKGEVVGDDGVSRRVRAAIHETRSGDIYVVPAPYTLFLQGDNLAATHGSPWSYDTHVPMVLSGAGLTTRRVAQRVDVRSLAPSVAALLQIPAPAAAAAPLLPGIND